MADKLTKEQAIARVKAIKFRQNDDETAHGLEDELFLHFIKSVAAGQYLNDAYRDEAVEVANILLESANLDIQRWCA